MHAQAGESQEGIKGRRAWQSSGAAALGGSSTMRRKMMSARRGAPASRGEEHSTVVARTFDYADESKCDSHMHIFLQSIAAAEQSEGQGFAAIKVLLPDH